MRTEAEVEPVGTFCRREDSIFRDLCARLSWAALKPNFDNVYYIILLRPLVSSSTTIHIKYDLALFRNA